MRVTPTLTDEGGFISQGWKGEKRSFESGPWRWAVSEWEVARVNIDEGAFASAKIIATRTGITKATVLGMLATLWHDSQAAEVHRASAQDILAWMDFDFDDPGPSEVIAALVSAGLLRKIDNDYFEIVGNEKHIDNLRERRESAREAGIRSGKVRRKHQSEPTHDAGTVGSTPSSTPSSTSGSTNAERAVELRTEQSSTEQNNKTTTRKRVDYGSGFEEVYESYPRREGKSAGFKVYERDIKTPEEREALLKAIQNYRRRKVGTEPKFLLHFSTFMNQWRDWLDESAGTVAPLKGEYVAPETKAELDEFEREMEKTRRMLRGEHAS